MKITTYGVRGSSATSDKLMCRYGGNTTCLRIESKCLPRGHALIIDTGSGFLPASRHILAEAILDLYVLYTHYHHDHTQGITMAKHTHNPKATFKIWGPKEHAHGPLEIIQELMRSPHFPVDFKAIRRDRFHATAIEHVGTSVLVIHPEAGAHLIEAHKFARCDDNGRQLTLGSQRYRVNECLVIYMFKTAHPEYTVSYRLEERPTGKVFVFLTDHENTAGIPRGLLRHVYGANLLIQDAQYSSQEYLEYNVGFGHGTPEYCAELATKAKVERLGLTHHDPDATDDTVDVRVREACKRAQELGWGRNSSSENEDLSKFLVNHFGQSIFGCKCYQEIEC